METVKQNQYNIELNYINNTFFSNMTPLSKLVRLKTRPAYKCKVRMNNNPYLLYKYDFGSTLIIPNIPNLLDGNFQDVYEIKSNKNYGINLLIIKKTNEKFEFFNYNFVLNSQLSNNMRLLLSYYNIEDGDNELYKIFKNMNVTTELFLVRHGHSKLSLPKNELIIELRKDENGICKKYISESIKNHINDYINKEINYEQLNIEEDSSLIETSYKILKNNKNEKVKIKNYI